MKTPWQLPALALALITLAATPAGAQTPAPRPLTDAECQTLRERVADHAKLSDGVRRMVATRAPANATPPSPAAASPAPAPPAPVAAPASRATEIRARLEQIKTERQQAEDGRIGAIARFDLGQVGRLQTQMTALDQEKPRLESELAALPATPPAAAPVPATAPAAATPPAAPREADRLRCQDMTAAHDEAVRIRQKELGAKEGQLGVVPLVMRRGQTPADVARDLAVQMPDGQHALVGLLDTNGDGRVEAFVDMPARGVHRVYRQQAGGSVRVEVPGAPATGAPYGEIPRRIDETMAQQASRTIPDLLATRPVGAVRVTAETPDWAPAWTSWLAGNYAEVGRLERPAVRSLEYQNVRGESVRVVEVLAPTGAGVALRRLVALTSAADREQWEETVTTVRSLSFTRVEVEVTRTQETRTALGATVGARSAAAPARFTIDR